MQIEVTCVGTLRPAVPGTQLVVDGVVRALCPICGGRAEVAGGVLGPHSAQPPADNEPRAESAQGAATS